MVPPTDHPAHNLFRRDPPTDGATYPPVGSLSKSVSSFPIYFSHTRSCPAWRAAYLASSPDVSALPKPWLDALNATVAAGKVPNISQSGGPSGQNPVHPQGVDIGSPAVCSTSLGCRNGDDFWDAPPGVFATSFNDSPTPVSLF
jgi:chitin deacetylase